MELIRINKFLGNSGVCSRRQADEYIEAGRISINGVVVEKLGTMVNQTTDKVALDGVNIEKDKKNIYIMLNKPQGYVTTSKDQYNRPSVVDLIKEHGRIYPVGRLDMYSEGLLLLTNDGEFTNSITHPSKQIAKTYIVKVDIDISDKQLKDLENGVDIDGYVTGKAISKRISSNEFELCIFEGKNRQIRRMCESLGFNVINLKRIKIGKLELGNLKKGEYLLLKEKDLKKIHFSD